jgi:NADH-quinone oxidoreductase subunit M
MAVAGLGAILTAVYFLTMLRQVDFGTIAERWRDQRVSDVAAIDLAAWVPLVVLAVGIGLWPKVVLGVSDAAVHGLFA